MALTVRFPLERCSYAKKSTVTLSYSNADTASIFNPYSFMDKYPRFVRIFSKCLALYGGVLALGIILLIV